MEPVFGDGAEIEVKGFGRTPVQADISEVQCPNFFWEQPMDEGLTLLRLGVDKQVHTYRISPEDLGKKMAVIVPSMLMCWFGEKDVNKVSRIRECEYPGFEEKELVTVTYRAREIQGIEIPGIFWDEFDRLNSPS
ncbi:hypothetical protein COY16_03675 [Candidatus Roizmanbacteria bacterium CG_4_10_14_0_2_um_filter_39_13]|uniref:Uncharacterized protein n=2 Tax=Candidatus Roizmaniibacteriota TaxID=1752723 RepID=A0A2M7TXZ4_9BACT|nr:MAG: hypothetical protein COY16_03675 [Candidatus Roizmanbacteria bacterium CG_4_10_14_0_2_um_filter_39_13]